MSRALGISVSTVKRWVDSGVLPARKTAGGHRKLLVADVLRVAKQEQLPALHLDALLGGTLPDRPRSEGATNENEVALLTDALSNGDRFRIRAVIWRAVEAQRSIAAIADQLIAPAMTRLGHDWENGRIDVFHEHRATQFVLELLVELKAKLGLHVHRDGPMAVGGAPEGDFYSLGSLLGQMTLLENGWQAIQLGSNTPLWSFSRAIKELHPRLVWISASHLRDPVGFVEEMGDFCRNASEIGVAVVIGGRAITEAMRATLPCSLIGENLTQLADFAQTLQ